MNEPVLLATKHVHLPASEVGLRELNTHTREAEILLSDAQWGYTTNTHSTGTNVLKCFFLPINKKQPPTGLFLSLIFNNIKH